MCELSLTLPLMWPDCPWVNPFDVTVTMRHWGDSFTGGSWMWCLCGWWVQSVVEGYHIMQALELVCRSIVWRQTVGVHTSMDYCLNTQLWRTKGVGFAIVWPQFIVHLLEPIILSVSVCVGTVSVDANIAITHFIFSHDQRVGIGREGTV